MALPVKVYDCDVLVVGSGPGGSTTASRFAMAGRDVILVEEGGQTSVKDIQPYSLEEQNRKYRNGGLTPAFGKPKIPYLEACCVGGASEINAGLYHLPLPETLNDWQQKFNIRDFSYEALGPFFRAIENEMKVGPMPGGVGPASQKILQGAEHLRWKAAEIPRCWQYSDGNAQGWRRSMTETLIPKAAAHGCRVISNTRIQKIIHDGRRASHATGFMTQNNSRQGVRINFRHIFVCGGAIQTPLLLRRSGLTKNIGDSLRMHPAVRIVAEFPQRINFGTEGVPVVQVQEFKPKITLGGSNSSLPHLALWLAGQKDFEDKIKRWQNFAIFYALITSTAVGRVRPVPFLEEPFVQMSLTDDDLKWLGRGISDIGRLLFAAGAVEVLSPVEGSAPFQKTEDLNGISNGLFRGRFDVSTIHLFCSCPMGEDLSRCAADSFGRLHGQENIYLNDASILPDTPAVNPQATIMAIGRRNIEHFLNTTKA